MKKLLSLFAALLFGITPLLDNVAAAQTASIGSQAHAPAARASLALPLPKSAFGVGNGTGLSPINTGNIFENRIFGYPFGVTGSNFTFQDITGVPYYNETILVRAVYENSAATPYTVSTAFASGRAFEANPLKSSDGTAAGWTVAATSMVVPASPGGTGVISTAATPWILLQVDSRTDGSPFGAIYMRTYTNTAGAGVIGSAGFDTTTWHAQNFHNDHESFYQSGNFTTASQTSFVPTVTNSYYNVGHLQVLSPKKATVIASNGDSTNQGLTTPGQSYGFIAQAAEMLSTVARPVGWLNYGSSGQTSTYFLNQTENKLVDGHNLPAVLVIQPASQNDASPYTTATVNSSYAQALRVAQLCRRMGVVPIFRTMQPGNFSSAQEIVRLDLNSRIRASGFPYLDSDAILSNNVSPVAALKPEFDFGDHTHPNTAGHNAEAQALVVLFAAINVYP